jgi:hypothetical protein
MRSSGTQPESKVNESPSATIRYVPGGFVRLYSVVRKPSELSLKPAHSWKGRGAKGVSATRAATLSTAS